MSTGLNRLIRMRLLISLLPGRWVPLLVTSLITMITLHPPQDPTRQCTDNFTLVLKLKLEDPTLQIHPYLGFTFVDPSTYTYRRIFSLLCFGLLWNLFRRFFVF